jgi:hypothetical protein
MLCEQGADRVLVGGEGKIAHKDIAHIFTHWCTPAADRASSAYADDSSTTDLSPVDKLRQVRNKSDLVDWPGERRTAKLAERR